MVQVRPVHQFHRAQGPPIAILASTKHGDVLAEAEGRGRLLRALTERLLFLRAIDAR